MVTAIPFLPLGGAAVMLLAGRRLPKLVIDAIACGVILAAFVLAMLAEPGRYELARWMPAIGANWAFAIDALSQMMMRLVTGVALLIHLYSTGYMKGEDGYARYFGSLNLFVFFMLLLVMADNLALTFAGWEGVGLASYLLIGFFQDRVPAGNAANKAFLVNRVGDLGLLLAMFTILASGVSLRYEDVLANSALALTPVPLLIFFAATGKSAQLPLYTWLPDAMEGPTPVSALIHAATMVTAGVYLIARCAPLFGDGMPIVAGAGIATALLAALLASVQTDIKRVLAYSTVSQLGLMFTALGIGAYEAAVFHLFTHAFFKALLFLGAGSVIHGLGGEQDLRYMGGLRGPMPKTFWLMVTGVLAIAGVPGLAGFFSKDQIVGAAFHAHPALGAATLAVSMMTAFYMWRLLRLAFLGPRRTDAHPHEAPVSMLAPMAVLALGSIVAGWINVHLEVLPMVGALAATAMGLLAAHRGLELNPALEHLHGLDAIYQRIFVRGIANLGAAFAGGFDRYIVDGAVNGAGAAARAGSRLSIFGDTWIVDGLVRLLALAVKAVSYPVRVLQSGSLQSYALLFLTGVAALLGWALWG